jgi:hypothetical protein
MKVSFAWSHCEDAFGGILKAGNASIFQDSRDIESGFIFEEVKAPSVLQMTLHQAECKQCHVTLGSTTPELTLFSLCRTKMEAVATPLFTVPSG